jgi:hypothetical protein
MYLVRNYYGFIESVRFSVATSLYSDLITKQRVDHKLVQSSSIHLTRLFRPQKQVQSSSVHMRHCSHHKKVQSSSVHMLRHCSLAFTSPSDRPNIAVESLAPTLCIKQLTVSNLRRVGQLLGYFTTAFELRYIAHTTSNGSALAQTWEGYRKVEGIA